jgi:hypothetical protein
MEDGVPFGHASRKPSDLVMVDMKIYIGILDWVGCVFREAAGAAGGAGLIYPMRCIMKAGE